MIRGTPFSAVTAQRDPLPGQVTFNHDMVDDMADSVNEAEERQAVAIALAYKPVHGGHPDYPAYIVKGD